jgi:site-specific DNA-methyltransferase (adenine-specific)
LLSKFILAWNHKVKDFLIIKRKAQIKVPIPLIQLSKVKRDLKHKCRWSKFFSKDKIITNLYMTNLSKHLVSIFRNNGIFLALCFASCYNTPMSDRIIFGDNLPVLRSLPAESVDLIYIDPPFNTGRTQSRTQIKTERSENGDRVGFQGRRYETIKLASRGYTDIFDDFLGFIEPRLLEVYRLLKPHGSLYFHIDYREVHYCKVLLDQIFGRDSFLNEIIWAYDYGARTKKKWPAKHDNILWYAKDPEHYTFNYESLDRLPYMAPGLVGPEKAARGKTPTDTWWHTIVPTNGREKTGYPTQKPLGILRRILQASSNPGEHILDFFAGSGTTGAAARELSRTFTLIDNNPQSLEVMRQRFGDWPNIDWVTYEAQG